MEKRNYKIKSEYWDMWGVNNDDEAIINYDELERLAMEWEIPVDELMRQVEQL